ncbi:MAG: hypothetical protein KKH74_06270 [Gammaproteobacteria bacterium]|nr:hypothetical protein [Gammaproteobacteria bacterium]MBU1732248.1 hypothetical protein [Gammaproteobacteria bacterium]MBU1893818.1 hypothetical protein [Gammaproteobacteria bacterium]
MKIEQETDFKPITITLETREEVIAVWTALRTDTVVRDDIEFERGYAVLRELSDWFSNHAHL